MEKVRVLKNIPGLLRKGEILVSATEGEDFKLDLVQDDSGLHQEKHVRLDYLSVCANIPTHFTWVVEDEDIFEKESFKIVRSEAEIAERVQFYRDSIGPNAGHEKNVVFNNLLWLIEWLTGRAELLK